MRRLVFCVLLALDVASVVPAAQTINPAPRAVIALARPLTAAEVARIFDAARGAIADQTLRLSYQPGGPGPELLMARDGRPRFIRAVSGYTSWSGSATNGLPPTTRQYHADVTELTEYTRQPARRCDASDRSSPAGELVIEYRNENGTGWTAKARARTPMEFGAPIFDMLTGVLAVESAGVKSVGDRSARGFSAPWKPPSGTQPGGPLPANLMQTLWIDVETLRPLRWEISSPTTPAYGMTFGYTPLEIRPPDGVAAPECLE